MGLASSPQALEVLVDDRPERYHEDAREAYQKAAKNAIAGIAVPGVIWLLHQQVTDYPYLAALSGIATQIVATAASGYFGAVQLFKGLEYDHIARTWKSESGPDYMTSSTIHPITRWPLRSEREGAATLTAYDSIGELFEKTDSRNLGLINGIVPIGVGEYIEQRTVQSLGLITEKSWRTYAFNFDEGHVNGVVTGELLESENPFEPLLIIGHRRANRDICIHSAVPAMTIDMFYDRNRPRDSRLRQKELAHIFNPSANI